MPAPPLTAPVTLPPLTNAKVSAWLPPVRLLKPEKVTPLTWPAFLPVTDQALAALPPTSVSPLAPTTEVMEANTWITPGTLPQLYRPPEKYGKFTVTGVVKADRSSTAGEPSPFSAPSEPPGRNLNFAWPAPKLSR